MPTDRFKLLEPQDQDLPQRYAQKIIQDPHLRAIQTLFDQKICVMGGCGQVGSHLITQLYEYGCPLDRITINDDLRLGKRHNLPEPLRPQVDTRSHQAYALQPPERPDILIFVGGRSSVPHFHSLTDVVEELALWQTILEWCVTEKIRLIFASTSSLCKQRPSLEDQPVWPGSLYELAKLMMENMAIQQALDQDLEVQICRFFSVYGVTERHKGNFGNLYTQILWHALEQEPFELWGQPGLFVPGEQTRDTIFAAEVCRALLHLLTLPLAPPRLEDISGLIYNIGQGQPVPIREMIEQVKSLLSAAYQPIIVEADVPASIKNYVVHTWGDPHKLLETGFQPIFTNHRQNLTLIAYALQDQMSWYWSMVEAIRQDMIST
ncbi:MAG: NAD(P)-dependent oxidoreductase [Acaryochloridaceae cyanobacterium SU_2_1]|nr:NAD(P)-dependent oxidoreductase [Acaryochloridaceae cyanobacterium SU_2_1]